jgi:hypothetical protein
MTDTRSLPGDLRLGWRITLLLGCYPPWWRVRYDDEMRDTVLALRDEGRWTAGRTRDLVRGVAMAWVNPAAVPTGEGMPARERSCVPLAAWGLLLFVLGGAGFAKLLDDPTYTPLADQHRALAWSVAALMVVAIATAVLMGVVAVIALVALVRRPGRRWQMLAPLLAVPLSGGAFALTLAVAQHVTEGTATTHDRRIGAFVALVLVTVVCGVACTVALMRVALRAPETRAVAVSRRIAFIAVGVLTSLAAISVFVWTFAAARETPGLLRSDSGLVSTPTLLTLCLCLAALSSGAGLCARAALGVQRVWRT